MIEYPTKIDLASFEKPNNAIDVNDAKYGLPKDVRFCIECVESNQRPSTTVEFKNKPGDLKQAIEFNEEQICSACLFAAEKSKIDWQKRDEELREVCNKFRKTDGSYDCIVPGSGGKDSILVAHELKYKYGMHPLTVTWAPHLYTPWGRENHDAWIHSGQDNILWSPNGKVHRLLTRLALDTLFHPFQPFILGQKSLAPRLAASLGIKLVFYGEHEAEYGSPVSSEDVQIQKPQFFSDNGQEGLFISGVPVPKLISEFGIELAELNPYLPIDPGLTETVEVHYFGYYRKWHPQGAYYYAVENSGFKASPERTSGTYSKYSSIDDKVDDLHYYTTGIKFGRGRATEDAAQEIRSGEINREEGIQLVKRYDLEYPDRFEKELFQYLSIPSDEFPKASKMFEEPIMSKNYFSDLSDSFRSPHLWRRQDGEWRLRHAVWQGNQ